MKNILIALLFLCCPAIAGATEYKNEALSDLAVMFSTDKVKPTFMIDSIDVSKLDYSLESLKEINSYLEKVRNTKGYEEHGFRVILRAGAYVGEVLRKNSKNKTFNWIDFEQASKLDQDIAGYGKSIQTAAILYDGDEGFIFPLAKVNKYLLNGSEDNLYFYASVLLSM